MDDLLDRLQSLRERDDLTGLRQALRWIAKQRDHWAGIPMPVKGLDLVIEKTYPYAGLSEIYREDNLRDRGYDPEAVRHVRLRNRFWSTRYKVFVNVGQEGDGPVYCWPDTSSGNKATLEFNTIMASDAWGLEQESRALALLGRLITHRQMKQYLLTGMFLESSKRSGVTYIFRKLRPTLALRPAKDGTQIRILCAMCMHPIAYYSGSWGGAMCPTDDVVAHLVMMRGDEHMFWRRCNQHPPYEPQAGI